MEPVKQERHDLLNDNPVDRTASGGRSGSWMSKHTHGSVGSPLHKRPDPTKPSKPSYTKPKLPTESVS